MSKSVFFDCFPVSDRTLFTDHQAYACRRSDRFLRILSDPVSQCVLVPLHLWALGVRVANWGICLFGASGQVLYQLVHMLIDFDGKK